LSEPAIRTGFDYRTKARYVPQQSIREIEARVVKLEREREILKQSTAFFVKEMDRFSK
jgi:transposase-like protein